MRNSKTHPTSAVNARWRDLNAFTHITPDFAASPAEAVPNVLVYPDLDPEKPLSGYSLVVKDNIEVAGMPCTCGTPALRTHVAQLDAPAVALLRSAGARIVAKTNMHELAYGITSNNAAFGPVRNAYDPTCFAGGSSGGTAVAIATELVRAGLGTDTGGSSRIPAALNGIVGFRPSVGRYPMAGVARISHTRDVIGPMGREVSDVALLDAVLSGDPTAKLTPFDARGLRLGLPARHFQESLHVDVSRALESTVECLRDAGVVFVNADLPNIAEVNTAVSFPVVLYETRHALQTYLREAGLNLTLQELHDAIASPDVKELVGLSLHGHIAPHDYQHALGSERPRLQQIYRDYFAAHRVEAVLFATTPLPAAPIAGSDSTVVLNGARVPTFATYIRNTDPASNAGVPAISFPAVTGSGHLPLGVEIDGPYGSDRRLLAIAAALQAILERHSTNPQGLLP